MIHIRENLQYLFLHSLSSNSFPVREKNIYFDNKICLIFPFGNDTIILWKFLLLKTYQN